MIHFYKNSRQGLFCATYIHLQYIRYERNDFTVVIQPAFNNIQLFKVTDQHTGRQVCAICVFTTWPAKTYFLCQVPDYSFFAPDCLHPSKKLHELMARALWNNMLSPLNKKATSLSRNPPFICPSADYPFLATRLNSYFNLYP